MARRRRRPEGLPYDLPTLTCDRCGRGCEAALCPDCLRELDGLRRDRRWNGRDPEAETDAREAEEMR